jgi:hypothetical protein
LLLWGGKAERGIILASLGLGAMGGNRDRYARYRGRGRGGGVRCWHVYPIGDRREHEMEGGECGCFPRVVVDGDGDILVLHNSFDGRELSGGEWNERLN